MPSPDFLTTFSALTDTPPFPWQSALYERFISNDFPTSASIPNGLGKTAVIAVWLIALAHNPDHVPRRLVYVVNRRTVVDQTTTEVKRLREALTKKPELAEIRNLLASLCALPLPTSDAPPLAISTLRGQFADNGEWCTDPSRPAVIAGTVDMIGSGLLFSRYARGFKTRPLHAGFLAQDALLVHDEAHLEPSFQKLLESIVATQRASGDPRALRVLELTATSRTANANAAPPFTLTDADREENDIVKERYKAVKRLSLIALSDGEKLDSKLVALAKKRSGERTMLIFTRSVESAMKIATELDKGESKGKVAILTGTMRGKERDKLVTDDAVFQCFLPQKDRAKKIQSGTVFLVATSAGEVGVNISSDDLLCDLSTYDSMAQRFGRVNRFGKSPDSEIVVVHETKFDADKPVEAARERTLALLKQLGDSASPAALDTLPADKRTAAFSPPPELRVATDIQFDAWALTSIRHPIAACPPVAPYLHGQAEWQPPETHVAWREEIDILKTDALRNAHPPSDLLEDFPLKPHELLRDTTKRVFTAVKKLVENAASVESEDNRIAWLINADGEVGSLALSRFLTEDTRSSSALEASLADATLILPASLGGIKNWLLTPGAIGDTDCKADVGDIDGQRCRLRAPTPEVPAGFRLIRVIDTAVGDEDIDDSEEIANRYWLWLEAKLTDAPGNRAGSSTPETLDKHTASVEANASALAAKLFSTASTTPTGEPDLRRCLILAARWHDLGKNRAPWQRNLGNLRYDPAQPETILAKSGPGMRSRNVAEHYRHEFGSLNDAAATAEFATLSDPERDIVLHLIAAHHGRARPHFPTEEIGDSSNHAANPDADAALATETPRRFARLQKRFGRWGLAYLESLLRAADYAASAGIVAEELADPTSTTPISTVVSSANSLPHVTPSAGAVATATLAVNPANPGHYFACCGLFELATCLSPDALSWFEQDSATRQWSFHLANTPPLAELLAKITAAEIAPAGKSNEDDNENDEEPDEGENDEKDASAPPLQFGSPFDVRLDWWTTASAKTSALKVWAGTMKVLRMARAMNFTVKHALQAPSTDNRMILLDTRIAFESPQDTFEKTVQKALKKKAQELEGAAITKAERELEAEKVKISQKYENTVRRARKRRDESVADITKGEKVEPFYFDAIRGPNAHSRDVGFAANDLKLETLASPAVELLTLVGLQRATPAPAPEMSRNFTYALWTHPLPATILPAAVNGLLDDKSREAFRFESWFRTGQRKHKAFITARTVSLR